MPRKDLNIDSVTKIINYLNEKEGYPVGVRKIVRNDSTLTFSAIRLDVLDYTVTTKDKTEFIYGNPEAGYERKVIKVGDPIIELETYYPNGKVRTFQNIYSKYPISYPTRVFEAYDKSGKLIKKFSPDKIIHFTISDAEKLVKQRGGDRIIEATLNITPDFNLKWHIRYFSDKDGLSDYVINAKNGKVIGQKHKIVITE